MNDLVEVLMATYNGEKYVKQQIDSILAQSHENLHLKIRDDGSKDGTLNILAEYAKKYPEKVALLSNDQNGGVKANFSRLMEASKAQYVMFADQDDIWFKTKVSDTLKRMKEVEQLQSKKIPILIHSDLIVTDHHLALIHPSYWDYAHLFPSRQRSLNRLLVQNAITGCTVMVNKELLDVALPIPSEAIMHDWWVGLVAAAFGKVDFLNCPTMNYRQHGANTLGAQKKSTVATFLKNRWNRFIQRKTNLRVRSHQLEKHQQAQVFYQRYQGILKTSHQRVLQAYLQLQNGSFLKNRYLILRHRFFKNGFLRNLAALIFRP